MHQPNVANILLVCFVFRICLQVKKACPWKSASLEAAKPSATSLNIVYYLLLFYSRQKDNQPPDESSFYVLKYVANHGGLKS